MSELKGQLLGIILVILVFGGISVILANAFKTTANKVKSGAATVFDNTEIELEPDSSGSLYSNMLSY